MRKKLLLGVAAGLLLFGTAAYAGDGYSKIEVYFKKINIALNGQAAELSKDSILYNGSVYVPLRSMGEMLDAEVSWDDENQTVHLDFLKDRSGEAYQASTQGLYQYIAMEQNRILSEMVRDFKAEDMDSMKQVVADYGSLRDMASSLGDKEMSLSFDKMRAAVELLRSGWAAKKVDDYSLAWTIYYTNATEVNTSLKAKVSGKTNFTFQVNKVNN
ncbi:stalk domain-containing protein [Gorillibacterium sp. sgz5001074]|uniref:stalk domain-containing protein n=1 Tax=Gorillibacterium sp. sgz5001074 TaxID=3446695 RepID=UPI003F66BC9A